jgi:glutathione synthase/RimK-type ligase-like ATP-grasp enzyme
MIEVVILTPDPTDSSYASAWPTALVRLQRALDGVGIHTTPTPWTAHINDSAELKKYAHVLPLLTWGYHHDHARWLQACATWQRDGVAMSNPAQVLAWNSDKRYLQQLAAQGVAIPPTTWTTQPTQTQLECAFNQTGADELIVKPCVSGGAWKTRRVRRGDVVEETSNVEMLIQPYLPTIESEGETSLLYFSGRLSHVVNKRPVPGDFRVQEEFGGLYTLLTSPPAGAVALAEQVLASISEPLLYARIDTVPDADGRWLLMEAELIEPDFYLGVDPVRGGGFAQALRGVITG